MQARDRVMGGAFIVSVSAEHRGSRRYRRRRPAGRRDLIEHGARRRGEHVSSRDTSGRRGHGQLTDATHWNRHFAGSFCHQRSWCVTPLFRTCVVTRPKWPRRSRPIGRTHGRETRASGDRWRRIDAPDVDDRLGYANVAPRAHPAPAAAMPPTIGTSQLTSISPRRPLSPRRSVWTIHVLNVV